jgi:hypothetical protein
VTSGGLVRQTVLACSIAAVCAAAVAAVLGHAEAGLAMAAGLVLGSLNGYLIQGLLNRGTPFVAASLMRILLFSSLVLLAALTLRANAWAFALGIGLAQLVLVGVGIRRGLRP